MKSILLLSILAFAMSNSDLLVELEAAAKPLPVVKCLIASEIIRKDVVVVVDAVKQFIEDKNAFLLITKLLGVYPEVEAEVKRCLKEEGVNLKATIPTLPDNLKKLWGTIPSKIREEIVKAYKKNKQYGVKKCYELLTKNNKAICRFLNNSRA